ncbi:MAG: DNA-3-methyladenine glycosylase [Candidatus Eremiobacteraeota bacterium]|nr:DNA-3-methyladenine glycosylase [Candidatus Eremiobacteraeota bacterium]
MQRDLDHAPLARDALPSTTVALAKALIGRILVRDTAGGRTAGRIVETEAYLTNDAASHAFRGETKRNASMFLPPFHAYVYQIYGTYFCLNISTEAQGRGEAVLLRALEPLNGLPLMMRRRGSEKLSDLCRGPGRLCAAMDVDTGLDGLDLFENSELWLADSAGPPPRLGTSTRIGITKAPDEPLRFYEVGSRFVSGPRHLSP